jgi:3-oxoadipate enol-lactonase
MIRPKTKKEMTPMGTRSLRLRDAVVVAEEAGDGPPLLLLHAGIADRTMWDRQWAWLQEHFRVVRWDWPGFGESPRPERPVSFSGIIAEVMDALAIPTATLVGCSLGGTAALHLALTEPARAERLVLVGSGIHGYRCDPSPEDERLAREWQEAEARSDVRRLRALAEAIWVVGPRRRLEQVDAGYLTRARDLLARAIRGGPAVENTDTAHTDVDRLDAIRVPVLVIVGTEDEPDAVSSAHVLADRIPGAILEEIEDAAHLPSLERPRRFDAILADWLAATRSPASDPGLDRDAGPPRV